MPSSGINGFVTKYIIIYIIYVLISVFQTKLHQIVYHVIKCKIQTQLADVGDTMLTKVWRMIWAKSTYRNDSPRNPAVAGFRPIRERIRAVARYPATARCLIA